MIFDGSEIFIHFIRAYKNLACVEIIPAGCGDFGITPATRVIPAVACSADCGRLNFVIKRDGTAYAYIFTETEIPAEPGPLGGLILVGEDDRLFAIELSETPVRATSLADLPGLEYAYVNAGDLHAGIFPGSFVRAGVMYVNPDMPLVYGGGIAAGTRDAVDLFLSALNSRPDSGIPADPPFGSGSIAGPDRMMMMFELGRLVERRIMFEDLADGGDGSVPELIRREIRKLDEKIDALAGMLSVPPEIVKRKEVWEW